MTAYPVATDEQRNLGATLAARSTAGMAAGGPSTPHSAGQRPATRAKLGAAPRCAAAWFAWRAASGARRTRHQGAKLVVTLDTLPTP